MGIGYWGLEIRYWISGVGRREPVGYGGLDIVKCTPIGPPISTQVLLTGRLLRRPFFDELGILVEGAGLVLVELGLR